MPDVALLISCEHAVNHVPQRFLGLFAGQPGVLDSHRGYDAGARELAETLARALRAPCLCGRVTRLLVDLNRSPHNRSLWSEFSRRLDAAAKEWLLTTYYLPFRTQTDAWLSEQLATGRTVLHLSVHSFTPVLDGKPRRTDIGLLHDPHRGAESLFARALQKRLRGSRHDLRILRNDPYRGVNDGHQTGYRRRFAAERYLAIELEINQRLVTGRPREWSALQQVIAAGIAAELDEGL